MCIILTNDRTKIYFLTYVTVASNGIFRYFQSFHSSDLNISEVATEMTATGAIVFRTVAMGYPDISVMWYTGTGQNISGSEYTTVLMKHKFDYTSVSSLAVANLSLCSLSRGFIFTADTPFDMIKNVSFQCPPGKANI